MTLAEFIELHKDSPFTKNIDIEVVIALLTCNGRIDLEKPEKSDNSEYTYIGAFDKLCSVIKKLRLCT